MSAHFIITSGIRRGLVLEGAIIGLQIGNCRKKRKKIRAVMKFLAGFCPRSSCKLLLIQDLCL